MPILSFGPFEFRLFSGDTAILDPKANAQPDRTGNWTDLEFAFVTDRSEAGFATRETALRTGFKSEHLLELAGEDDTSDTKVVNGTTYNGKRSTGFDGKDYVLSAEQIAARAEFRKAMRESRNQAKRAAEFAAGNDPSITVEAAPAA